MLSLNIPFVWEGLAEEWLTHEEGEIPALYNLQQASQDCTRVKESEQVRDGNLWNGTHGRNKGSVKHRGLLRVQVEGSG